MEYQNVPAEISSKKAMVVRIDRAIAHIESYAKDGQTGVKTGDEYLSVDKDLMINALSGEKGRLLADIVVLEGIHDTITKVAAGLLK